MDEVKREADERGVKLIVLPTAEAIKLLKKDPLKTNAILDVTCGRVRSQRSVFLPFRCVVVGPAAAKTSGACVRRTSSRRLRSSYGPGSAECGR